MAGVAAAALAAPLGAAHAAGTINFGDGQSISIGLGLRGDVTFDNKGNADGGSSTTASLDSVRLYVNGQLTKQIGATFNTERDGNGNIVMLDGYARFEFKDEFNVWVGRMLPPTDRSNLDGPYYLSSWNYPGVVSQYPAKFAGRDDGVTVWGKLLDKKLTYAVGVFNGHDRIAGAANHDGQPLVAARFAYNFWDVEDNPGYYTSSTYYGAANVATLAFVVQHQADGVGTASRRGDYTAWNVDGLLEKKIMDGGAVTLEGAYYDYNTQGVLDVAPDFNDASSTANVGGITQGHAFLVSGGVLLPTVVGVGRFQPVVRYQEFDATISPKPTTRQYDASLNYIIKGHNARLSLDYAHESASFHPDDDRVTAGVQLQF